MTEKTQHELHEEEREKLRKKARETSEDILKASNPEPVVEAPPVDGIAEEDDSDDQDIYGDEDESDEDESDEDESDEDGGSLSHNLD